jgi:hypothetical protein
MADRVPGDNQPQLEVSPGIWRHAPDGSLAGNEMDKELAEFVGTFAFVFFGCGAAVIGGMGSGPTAVDLLWHSERFRLRHRRSRQSGRQLRRLRRRAHEP